MRKEELRILLADDDLTDRLLFKEAFEELALNTTVHMVNNGEELMDYLNNPGSPVPHILFLDLNMPQRSGIECMKEIKAIERLKEMAIAIYSTSATEADIESTFRNGANVYIQKPNDFETLKKILKKAVISAENYDSPPFNKANFLLRM